MIRQPYTPAKLYVDFGRYLRAGECPCSPGCYIVSSGQRARAAYLVQTVRESNTVPGRRHLGVLRWPREEVPDGACVHRMTWYPRKPRRTIRLADLSRSTER